MPAPNSRLPEWRDMQGLVLSAYPHLHHAAYLPLRIDHIETCRAWLAWLAPDVTRAIKPASGTPEPAVNLNLAVACSGLRKLCGDHLLEKGLGYPFMEGIAGRGHRSRLLGDTGSSSPAGWTWGGTARPVDLLVMLFARSAHLLAQALNSLQLPSSGATEVARLIALPLDIAAGREHFGFVDGISQPLLRGTPDAERYPESIHLTELGEIVFGYPNADGRTLTGPQLRDWPQFGCNGTYVVFRQLYQNVDAFWTAVSRHAGTPYPPASETADRLAAKIVGRERDGTPLVPYVNRTDNEFTFADDPDGFGCPMSSHVRRTNPRESLTPSPRLARLANRHRLLRRGRVYGTKATIPGPDNVDRGLLFLAMNADFEQQFEFISQNWVNNDAFDGLERERDPLVGDVDARGVFSAPGFPLRTRFRGLPRFVHVRGGEYFFLPGLRALRRIAGLPVEG